MARRHGDNAFEAVDDSRKRHRKNDGPVEASGDNEINDSTPEPWEVCIQEWITKPTKDVKKKLCLLDDEDFLEQCEYNPKTVIDAFFEHSEDMEMLYKRTGKPMNSPIGKPLMPMMRYFILFPNELIDKIVTYTNKQLAHDGKLITNAFEIREMICLFWIRTRYRVSTHLLWSEDMMYLARGGRQIVFPSEDRFIYVLRAMRGFTEGNKEDGVDDCIVYGCSDLGQSVMTYKRVPVEIKFLFHGFGGPLAYLWRAEQKDRLIKPCVEMHRLEHEGADPSIEVISEMLENEDNLLWDDYVYDFAYECLDLLQHLGRDGVHAAAAGVTQPL